MWMEWVRNKAADREFERFAAEASDPLLRTGFLMTGNAKDAEDLVQETLLRVARRWNRVRSMDHPGLCPPDPDQPRPARHRPLCPAADRTAAV